MNRFFFYIALGPALFLISLLCNKATDGFSIGRITSHLPPHLTWATPEISAQEAKELNAALDQPYSYLAKGGQCFAFLSQDKRYVLKLFKTKFWACGSLRFHTLPCMPKETQERKMAQALFKLHRDFNSYTYACQELKEETALLYLHLNKTDHLDKKLQIIDKLGITHTIDLDQYEFAVQRRVELAYDRLDALLQQKELKKAKQLIRSLAAVCLARCRKGFYDEDVRLDCNFGFMDDQPIFIDIGRFVKDPAQQNTEALRKTLDCIAMQLSVWLGTHYPDAAPYLCEAIYE